MRTGIYVQKPTTVTIRASAPPDARVQLRRFRLNPCEQDARARVREPEAIGTHQLDVGIYLIVSSGPMQIAGEHLTTQIMADADNKDPWPDPELAVVGLVPGATAAAIKTFFAVAKGIEIDEPAGSPASTAKVTDDPDGI